MDARDLRELLRLRGLSQSKLAIMLGISRDRLRKMMNNQAPIPAFMGLAAAAIMWGLPPWKYGSNDGAMLEQRLRKEHDARLPADQGE